MGALPIHGPNYMYISSAPEMREVHGSAVHACTKLSSVPEIRGIHGSAVLRTCSPWSKEVHRDQLLADNGMKVDHVSVLSVS